jgi:hypothetical protein
MRPASGARDAYLAGDVSRRDVLARILIAAFAVSALVATSPAGAGPGRCAAREPRLATPLSAGPHALVRVGAATLLLCRYRGLNPARTALRLRSSRVVTDRAVVGSITAAFDHLPRQRASFHCPMDDGSAILATFSYARGADVAIRVGLRGCRTVTGPYLPVRTAISPGGARLVARLERLAP